METPNENLSFNTDANLQTAGFKMGAVLQDWDELILTTIQCVQI